MCSASPLKAMATTPSRSIFVPLNTKNRSESSCFAPACAPKIGVSGSAFATRASYTEGWPDFAPAKNRMPLSAFRLTSSRNASAAAATVICDVSACTT